MLPAGLAKVKHPKREGCYESTLYVCDIRFEFVRFLPRVSRGMMNLDKSVSGRKEVY
jgi:hypothetical protein